MQTSIKAVVVVVSYMNTLGLQLGSHPMLPLSISKTKVTPATRTSSFKHSLPVALSNDAETSLIAILRSQTIHLLRPVWAGERPMQHCILISVRWREMFWRLLHLDMQLRGFSVCLVELLLGNVIGWVLRLFRIWWRSNMVSREHGRNLTRWLGKLNSFLSLSNCEWSRRSGKISGGWRKSSALCARKYWICSHKLRDHDHYLFYFALRLIS